LALAVLLVDLVVVVPLVPPVLGSLQWVVDRRTEHLILASTAHQLAVVVVVRVHRRQPKLSTATTVVLAHLTVPAAAVVLALLAQTQLPTLVVLVGQAWMFLHSLEVPLYSRLLVAAVVVHLPEVQVAPVSVVRVEQRREHRQQPIPHLAVVDALPELLDLAALELFMSGGRSNHGSLCTHFR
jgi:hypothetical protein